MADLAHRRRSALLLVVALIGATAVAGCSSGSTGAGASRTSATANVSTSPPRHTPPGTSTSARGSSSSRSTSSTPAPTSSASEVLSQLPGSVNGSCVKAVQRNMRSGGIGGGDFIAARVQYKRVATHLGAPLVSLHFIPLNLVPDKSLRLTMTLQRLHPVVYTVQTDKVHVVAGTTYFDIQVPIRKPGPWRMRVSAGQDSGCFDIAFNPPSA